MYTINFITDENEIFTFKQQSDDIVPGNVFVIGNKILIANSNFIHVFDLINYKKNLNQNVLWKKQQVKTIEKIKYNYKKIFENVYTPIYIVFVDTNFSNVYKNNNSPIIMQNSYVLEKEYFNTLVYIDFLCNPVELGTLTKHKLIFLSYGIAVQPNTYIKKASRIFMNFSQFALDFILTNEKNIFLVNIRFTKDYQKPGCVAIFEQNRKIIYYFQCVCCKNTNNAVKHVNFDSHINVKLHKDTNKKMRRNKT